MLTRIVKLNIASEKGSEFERCFNEHKHIIKSFEGCNHVELLKSKELLFFTYSVWVNEKYLDAYRNSIEFENLEHDLNELEDCLATCDVAELSEKERFVKD